MSRTKYLGKNLNFILNASFVVWFQTTNNMALSDELISSAREDTAFRSMAKSAHANTRIK